MRPILFGLGILMLLLGMSSLEGPASKLRADGTFKTTSRVAVKGSKAKSPPKPDKRKDPWAIGTTGLFGVELKSALSVTHIANPSPASGKIHVNDEITHANGEALGSSPMRALLRALDKAHVLEEKDAEKAPEKGEEDADKAKKAPTSLLRLKVRRADKTIDVELEIKQLGSIADFQSPESVKAMAMLDANLAWLVKKEQGGCWRSHLSWQNGQAATVCMTGLALLARDDPKHRELLKEMADWVISKIKGSRITTPEERKGAANWNQDNWAWSFSGIFLAEYWLRSKDKAVADKLAKIAAALVKNQEADGGWSHGPGGPNALSYTTFVQMTLQCLKALQLAELCGVKVPAETITKGKAYVLSSLGSKGSRKGGIGYSKAKTAAKGYAQSGRTAFATLVFDGDKEREKEHKKMVSYMSRNRAKAREGHASALMHLVWQSLALKRYSASKYTSFIRSIRWSLVAAHQADGSAVAQPNRETRMVGQNFDRNNGVAWSTACNALVLASRFERLALQGAKVEPWPKAPEEGGKGD